MLGSVPLLYLLPVTVSKQANHYLLNKAFTNHNHLPLQVLGETQYNALNSGKVHALVSYIESMLIEQLTWLRPRCVAQRIDMCVGKRRLQGMRKKTATCLGGVLGVCSLQCY